MKLTTARRSTIAQGIIADMANGTAANPKIEFYTGTIPASMGGSITDTLLAELETTTTVATENSGVITFQAITEDSSANASDDVGWARALDRDGAEAIYFTVSASGAGGDIQFNSVSFVAGAPVSVSSLTVTVGAA